MRSRASQKVSPSKSKLYVRAGVLDQNSIL
jgi:hypothetical protein